MSNLYQNLERLDSDNLSCFLYFYTEQDSEELLFSCAWDDESNNALDKFCYLAYKVLSGELKDTVLSVIERQCDKKDNPDKEHTLRIHKQALKNGLVMITAGTYGNIIRTLMPLVINDEELEESLEILCNALKTP